VRRSGPINFVLVLLLAAMCPDNGLGQPIGLARKHHPWGTYQPGAWKMVRTVTETFEPTGRMSSVTDTKTSLQQVAEDGVTLQVQVSFEVGGKRFEAPPETVTQGFDNELAGPGAVFQELGRGEVTVQGRNYDCQLQQWERADVTGKTTVKVFYCDAIEPYVLRRETVKSDPQGKVRSETVYEVVALDVPFNVLGEILNTAHVKTVHKDAEGTTTTVARISMDVPGGVICHTLKEVNNEGNLIRRASLELIDYGLKPVKERPRLFPFRRPGRTRKSYRASGL